MSPCAQAHTHVWMWDHVLLLPAGPVAKLRLLGDASHTTRIAFVEFLHAEGASAALNCSGALLGKAWQTNAHST